MMCAFNDSGDTDRGLLLINYPSVESVKEAVALTYEEFVRSYVTVEDVSKYKSRVSGLAGSDAKVDHRNFSGYNIKAFTRTISHSVGKIQYLVKGMPLEETFPFTTKSDLSEQCRQISQVQLFDYQLRAYNVDGHIATCGTGPFFISLWAKSLDGAWKSCFGE